MRHFNSRTFTSALLVLLAALPVSFAQAHHSFAVHFVAEANTEVKGVVESFRFANPHGVLSFNVTDANGVTTQWKAETNSPNILRRRGWSKDSFKPGDEVTVLGFPARDGTPFMRISKVTFADGHELIGQGAAPPAQGEAD
ncbi:MAG: hypothetical protein RLZZ227_1120 [Pseudomonadota bacterium]|jgi:hypothetical protein